ncbi:MAG: hypothetical protein HY893_03885 [Deltaproteobacteria bacterium]|nr:hypothetical protein [Deltaproteobacteria bacterium]
MEKKKGVKSRMFGCVLLGLGILNTMLSLKGGLAPGLFDFSLILSGSILLISGVFRAAKN